MLENVECFRCWNLEYSTVNSSSTSSLDDFVRTQLNDKFYAFDVVHEVSSFLESDGIDVNSAKKAHYTDNATKFEI